MATTETEARVRLLKTLANMPDEAFGWVVLAIESRIWPDGLGGFMPDSRAAIEAARSAAAAYLKAQS